MLNNGTFPQRKTSKIWRVYVFEEEGNVEERREHTSEATNHAANKSRVATPKTPPVVSLCRSERRVHQRSRAKVQARDKLAGNAGCLPGDVHAGVHVEIGRWRC